MHTTIASVPVTLDNRYTLIRARGGWEYGIVDNIDRMRTTIDVCKRARPSSVRGRKDTGEGEAGMRVGYCRVGSKQGYGNNI